MIDLDRSLELRGISLFADHLDPLVYHYLPASPRLTNSAEHLAMLVFRGEQSGGFATVEVDLGHEDGRLEAARAELTEQRGSEVRLVPVLFDAGTARLVVPAGESDGAMVSEVLGVTTPSLLGDQRSIFSLRLSPRGTTLLRSALQPGGATVIGCAYELKFRGLQRSRALRIELEYHRAWELLDAQAVAGSLWLKADLRAAAERLVQEGAVRIHDESTELGTASHSAEREAEALRIIEEVLVPLYWHPEVAPAATSQPARAVRAGFRLRAHRQEESHLLVYDRRETGVVERTVAPQGSLVVPADFDVASQVAEIEEDEFFAEPRLFRVIAPPPPRWDGVSRVLVDVRSERVETTLELTADSLQAEVLLWPQPRQIRVRALRAEEPDALMAEANSAGDPEGVSEASEPRELGSWVDTDAWHLDVDPGRLAGRREVEVALGVVDPQVVRGATVRVSAGEATRTFRLQAEHPVERVVVQGRESLELHADFEPGPAVDSHIALTLDRSVAAAERLVLVQPPAHALRTVTAALVDPLSVYESVAVEIEGARGGGRRSLRLTATQPEANWSTLDAGAGTGAGTVAGSVEFRYRTTAVRHGGAAETTDWQEGSGTLLLVGAVDVRARDVEVHFLGVADHIGGILDAVAEEPAEGTPRALQIFVEPGAAQVSFRLGTRPHGSQSIRVQAQLFTLAGETLQLGPVDATGELVLLSAAEPQ